ncbi:cell division protein FtsL [Pararobbsia silviterrae]|uniref:Cell division protein FtsL n=1 Tax=Pararobbsia silviterrae TaxID=1792498 RepID=A0A494XIP9_9BURK|nr:cell division protein FtsL [Pararobbsia silviterrae]
MSRLNALLLLVVVICALSVVNATNRQRELFISLGRAQMQERQLQQDLAQLQYQQSSLSKTSRVEDTATSELKMETVTAGRTQYLTVDAASAVPGAAAAASDTDAAAASGGAANGMAIASGVGDDPNPATSSDLRAVIGASSASQAASKAAASSVAASGATADKSAASRAHAASAPTKAVKHAANAKHPNGASK